jgi:hypothetical protein
MGGGPREVAEHFVELHSSRVGATEEGSRGRLHSSRKDYLGTSDLKLEEVVSYLERVRDRAERSAPPTRRTQETQTIPAALLPATSAFLLQELPLTPSQHLHQVRGPAHQLFFSVLSLSLSLSLSLCSRRQSQYQSQRRYLAVLGGGCFSLPIFTSIVRAALTALTQLPSYALLSITCC